MKRTPRTRLGMIALIVSFVTATAFADVCVWDSTTFPGSYGCSNESCGTLCGEGYGFVSHSSCKSTAMSHGTSCCICSWVTWTCTCQFGTGTGSNSTRVSGYGACPEGSGPRRKMACVSSDL